MVIVFISTFGILLEITPTEFLAPDYNLEYFIQDYPEDTWVGREVGSWDETFLGVSNDTLRFDKLARLNISDIIDDEIMLIVQWNNIPEDDPFVIIHDYPIVEIFGITIIWDSDSVEDFITHEELYTQTLVESYLAEGTHDPQVARFDAVCDHYSYYISVAYNSTKFDSLTEAWEGNITYDPELWLFVGMGFESEWASLPTWMIIAQLLTFQAPDIHPVINGLIAIPLWIAVLYLAYHLLLRMLPFFGGA